MLDAVANAPKLATQTMDETIMKAWKSLNEWNMIDTSLAGKYGTKYHLRASVAREKIAMSFPEDLVDLHTCVSPGGIPLVGENRYMLSFKADNLPPVEAFWSITLYDISGFLIHQPDATAQRVKLTSSGNFAPLYYDSDGSLRLVFQEKRPTDENLVSNWLPTKRGTRYCITMRLYAPQEEISDLQWTPPAIQRIAEG